MTRYWERGQPDKLISKNIVDRDQKFEIKGENVKF